MLRLCLAGALLRFSIRGLSEPSEGIVLTQQLVAVVGGLLLLAGLWTPVVGALIALDEAGFAFSAYYPAREDSWIHIFVAMLAVSVAMLGPGAWSIDARLFGRQRFDIDRPRGSKSSL